MKCKTALALIVGLLAFSSPSWAQQSTTAQPDTTVQQEPTAQQEPTGTTPQKAPRLDIIVMGGYVWTVSQGGTHAGNGGDFDLKSGGYWGIAVDVNAMPGIQGRLLYRRQDTKATFKSFGTTDELGDIAVEYWHVGMVKAIMVKENVMPFTSFSLGATRYVADSEDDWKFSIILGVGAKIHINEKFGVMVTGQMPYTFTSTFLGIGTGGLSIGGSGIAQFDITAGVLITL